MPEIMALYVFGRLSRWQPRTWKTVRQSAIRVFLTALKEGILPNVDQATEPNTAMDPARLVSLWEEASESYRKPSIGSRPLLRTERGIYALRTLFSRPSIDLRLEYVDLHWSFPPETLVPTQRRRNLTGILALGQRYEVQE